jgi:ubiquinone/menaquinone biosynthesis C-methylase UbiE
MLRRFSVKTVDRNIGLRRSDGFNAPACNNEFDAVIPRIFMQHFPRWIDILREQARVSKRGDHLLRLWRLGTSQPCARVGESWCQVPILSRSAKTRALLHGLR